MSHTQRDFSTAALGLVMPLGAYIWHKFMLLRSGISIMGQCLAPDLLPLDLYIFEENLTLADQRILCEGRSNFEVL